ncbi:sigma-54-dependent transcriptional regulator [Haliangium ochraceum]|uniref:Two component, sigma54 specific, transcriptional regulator, Fis family n=1 Tax=Haliangium ochraceum (strain DSM 14365 / JCM 11303 / SMP-2) TaxID=502025 RepID=D0LHZ4_HALO1|nr:sigma-54 dependent transcriptional regulator [Haliangium ochraceum]ACY14823.1 two component, sigma54 specific, transcriptional regulator, Fis family [Haliangium ochraceum DSM 14365]
MNASVLVVDDDRAMCELVQDALSRNGYEVTSQLDAESALFSVDTKDFDVVITDIKLQSANGLELCRRVNEKRPDVPVVVFTAFGSIDTAVGAIRAGAYDYITKPVDLESLALTVRRAIAHRRLQQEVKELRQRVSDTAQLDDLVGASSSMKNVYRMIQQLGDSDASVLITGESGTGKELVARALHRTSTRKDGPFVAINCAAVPQTLLESELFGHSRGAFTDAKQARDGLFIQADNGTLFLDELGDMVLEMQSKLLRVLQERKVRPVGGVREIPFNTRIIAATNRDLESDVEANEFRQDLYYRINVVRIHVPPLRSRGNDILLLAQHFIEDIRKRTGKQVTGISSDAAKKLLAYNWPGNVRELQNCIERAVALTRFEHLVVDDLPDKIRLYQSTELVIRGDDPEEFPTLEELERRYIRRVLEATRGNKTQASRILGMNRRTLYRRIERLGLEE